MLRLAVVALIAAFAANLGYAQTCNGLDATIIGSENDDDLDGTPGADVIVGLGGNDRIDSLDGDDVICGGDGDDDLFGGAGGDLLFGDAGNDTLEGGADADVCDGVTGIDVADTTCETAANTDVEILPVRQFAADGIQLDGALYVPVRDAAVGGGSREVAIIVSHGAMGSFEFSVPKIVGMQGSPLGFAVLALNRRDSGADAGGGVVTFEDATLDLGVGIDLLNALGFESIFVTGHSQGTQNAAIYPSFTGDQRVAAVGLFGTVDDGRRTAQDVLFVFPPELYDEHVATAEALIADGRGDEVVPWDTVFGVQLFRSANNFLSFWGPDTLSVVEREITKLEVPALLLRADGDQFTPDEMSQNVLASALAAGIDATYTILDYPFPVGPSGGNAHGFLRVERELIQTTVDWLTDRVPAANARSIEIQIPIESPPGNRVPIVDTGAPVEGPGGTSVQLDASGSVDIDGQIVSYAWSQQSGDTAVLSTPDSAQSRLALPLTAQMLEFELAVTDDAGGVATALVQVTVTEDAPRSGGGSSAIGLLTVSLLLMLALTLVRRRRI